MHLLHIQDGGGYCLKDFTGKRIPPYAILSHTWGEDGDEVTFKDIRKRREKSKAGYQKISFCGEQAANDGLRFFWIDTCCIDRTSSAELSEAIVSMFRWYKNAAKCYVYLSDVSASSLDGDEHSFPKSRWFRRGWTLQELLAPSSVEFFSQERKRLGDRTSLMPQIVSSTGIPPEALNGGSLSDFSIDVRMSWLGERQTKLEEDTAYCLLGILDIQMPALYGEGHDNAHIRLRGEIEKRDRIQSSLSESQISTALTNFSFDTRMNTSQKRQPESMRLADLTVHTRQADVDVGFTILESQHDNKSHKLAFHSSTIPEKYTKGIGALPSRSTKSGILGASRQKGALLGPSKPIGKNSVPLELKVDSIAQLIESDEQLEDEKIISRTRYVTIQETHDLLLLREIVNYWLGIGRSSDLYNINQYYDKQISNRLEGTCQWIFNHPTYLRWASETLEGDATKFLWIYAPAGYGKTVLCARIIENLIASGCDLVPYFFASPHAQSGGNPSYIIRSWVSQIAHSDAEILLSVLRQVEDGQIASESTIWSLFESIVSTNRAYVFILDGFDEYSRTEDARTVFLQKLKKATEGTGSRVLVTSRDETDINAELAPRYAQDPGIVMLQCKITDEDVRHDISQFSRSVVDQRLPNKDESLKQGLAEQLASKCEGMFLWIKLQQDQLRGGKNAKQLQNIVKNMPSGLEKTYERNWNVVQNHSPKERSRALSILRWTTYALRPLTVAELTVALEIALDDDDEIVQWDELPDEIDDDYINSEIIEICGDLVEIRAEKSGQTAGSRTIHLVHASVRDFLRVALQQHPLEYPMDSEQHCFTPTTTITEATQHAYLAVTCLHYLSCRDVWERAPEQPLDEHKLSFTNYAARHWHSHVTTAGIATPQLLRQVKEFLTFDNANFKNWSKHYESSRAVVEGDAMRAETVTPLYYAALFNFPSVMEHIHAQNPDQVNAIGGEFGTPVQAVCYKGNETALRLLLGWGADLNIEAGRFGVPINAAISEGHETIAAILFERSLDYTLRDSTGRTPLYTAAMNGKPRMVLKLLEAGADKDTLNHNGWSAINAAASDGHHEVVKLLLDKGADFATINSDGWTPLNSAAESGYLKVVKLLVEKGADLTVANESGWTPLNSAANNGHLDVVKVLLGNGADIGAASREGWTPLSSSADSGHLEVVKLLLDKGADLSVPTNSGWTALNAAADSGHSKVVKLLLEKGADHAAANKGEWTPLNSAANNGHLEVVKILVEKGAEINAKSSEGWTPLNSAADSGHLEVVRYLLESGADLTLPTASGWTPLNSAAESGHVEVVRLLLESAADHTVPSSGGWTPMNSAANNGHLEVVKVLLEYGADHSVPSSDGWTPLNLAVNHGHLEIVKLLIEKDADITVIDSGGWTALNLAADSGHIDILKLLLEHDADLTVTNSGGWTPLNSAANNGHVEVIRLLLDHGADYNITNNELWTPLNSAANNGHLEVVKLLLERGADYTSPNVGGWTPLHSAADGGYLEMAKLLIDKGADISATSSHGWTSLHAAANCGHLEIVKLLLEHDADITVPNSDGWTPLNSAANNGHIEVVKLLLDLGADITIPSENGWAPLNSAADSGHIDVVKLLIEKGADVAFANKSGFTALSSSASKGWQEIVALLLEHGAFSLADGADLCYGTIANLLAFKGFTGELKSVVDKYSADLRLADIHGRTPLHYAAQGGHLETFQYLLDQGLDPTIADVKGSDLLCYASSGGSLEIFDAVLEKGVKMTSETKSWSALHWASRAGERTIVERLIEKGWTIEHVTVPDLEGEWDPLSVAIFHGVEDASEWFPGSAGALKDTEAHPTRESGKHAEGWWCNGCLNDIYGQRFHCRTCELLDYCFMCKPFLSHLHVDHEWEVVEPTE